MSFLDKDTFFIEPNLLKGKYICQIGEESFHEEVTLPVSPAMIHVRGNAYALRLFHPKVICQTDHRDSSSYIVDVKILVKGLRSTETIGIAGSEIDVFGRIISKVGTGAENQTFHQAVLVETTAHQDAPLLVLPFILGICTQDPDSLISNPVISPHIISQIVLIVFHTYCKIGWHKETAAHLIDILSSTHPCQVGSLSIRIRVLACAVIAFPADVLHRYEGVQTMLLIL